jgi:hypothetical protein
VRCISTVVHSNECQARPPMDHFMRILAEAWPNNAYPVKHNLKDYGMMSGFMTSGSLSKGTELIEDPGGSDTMPLFRENIVMMVYGGPPPPRRCRVSNLSPRAPAHCDRGYGGSGV